MNPAPLAIVEAGIDFAITVSAKEHVLRLLHTHAGKMFTDIRVSSVNVESGWRIQLSSRLGPIP